MKVFVLLLGLIGTGWAEPILIHLKNGQTMDVELVGIANSAVQWRLSANDATVQTLSFTQISHVDFQPPDEWNDAVFALESGRFDEAVQRFRGIAAKPNNYFYPAPGNFASRAQVQLLQCFRGKLDAESAARQAEIVERAKPTLPPAERELEPIIRCWIAAGQSDWEGVLKAGDAIAEPTPERSFLRGRAFVALGQNGEALDAFAETYTLGFGDSFEMNREALRQSAELLEGLIEDEERVPELRSLVKLYAELYGKGALWEGASDYLKELAAEELETIGQPPAKVEPEAPAP